MRRRGFTLLEILTVIAIVLILIGILLGVLAKARESAKRAQVLSFIKNVESSAKNFQLNYNRWPWEIEGATLAQKLPAADIFAELSPGNTSLTSASYQPLINKQRVEYLAIPPQWIKGGAVADPWGNPLEFFWNPDTRTIVIVSSGQNQINETVKGGALNPPKDQNDDINNL
jgi:prepilin-type N-terminal cleavage/methylation domain-containing protein